MLKPFLLLAVCFVVSGSPVTSPPESLRFVAIVTRHGSRSPLSSFPTDAYPYNERKFWPDGPGELTNFGKRQLYKTGKALRARYGGFLAELYYPNDTIVEHNPCGRDFNSAASLLAGLYPPVGPQMWNPEVKWQPIPIYVRPFDICDLNLAKGGCPLYKKESDKMADTLNFKNYDNQGLLDYVTKSTGKKFENLTQIYDIYDTLLMQSKNGYKLPEWSKQIYPSAVQPFAVKLMLLQYAGTDTIIQLGAGPELKYLSDMFNKKANGSPDKDNTRMYVEAAHDCSLIALLYAMGYNKSDLEIDTGAYLAFELHQVVTSHVVQVFYYRSPQDSDPILINIAKCPSPCSLEDFNTFVDAINPKNWTELCYS